MSSSYFKALLFCILIKLAVRGNVFSGNSGDVWQRGEHLESPDVEFQLFKTFKIKKTARLT